MRRRAGVGKDAIDNWTINRLYRRKGEELGRRIGERMGRWSRARLDVSEETGFRRIVIKQAKIICVRLEAF